MSYPPHHLSHSLSCPGNVSQHCIYHPTASWLSATSRRHFISNRCSSIWFLCFSFSQTLAQTALIFFFSSRDEQWFSTMSKNDFHGGWWTVSLLVFVQGERKTPRSLATAPHHSETTDAIDQGESTVSHLVPSSSSSTLREVIEACWGLSRGRGACCSVQRMKTGYNLNPGVVFTKTHYDSGVSRWLQSPNCYLCDRMRSHTLTRVFGVIMTMCHRS